MTNGGCHSHISRDDWSPQQTVLPSPPLSVPLIKDKTGIYYVNVHLNQQGPYRLMVDTGSYGLILAHDIITQLKARTTKGPRVYTINASGQRIRVKHIVHIDTLTLGEARFEQLQAIVHNRKEVIFPSDVDYDGILGIGLFCNNLLILDLPQKQLSLFAGSLDPQAQYVTPTISHPRDVPTIELTLQPVSDQMYHCPAVIDTGANTTKLPSQAQHWPIPRTYLSDVQNRQVGRKTTTSPRYRLQTRLDLGQSNCQLVDPIIGYDGHTARIGTHILSQMILVIDLQHQNIALIPEKHSEQLSSILRDQ